MDLLRARVANVQLHVGESEESRLVGEVDDAPDVVIRFLPVEVGQGELVELGCRLLHVARRYVQQRRARGVLASSHYDRVSEPLVLSPAHRHPRKYGTAHMIRMPARGGRGRDARGP